MVYVFFMCIRAPAGGGGGRVYNSYDGMHAIILWSLVAVRYYFLWEKARGLEASPLR